MKVFSILLVSLCFFVTCQSSAEQVTIPIEKERAVKILSDVRIIDELVKKYKIEERDSIGQVFMDSIYSIHKIDSSQFLQLIEYLHTDTRAYHALEKEVHTNLKKYLDGI